jgi:hypothetical protein
MPGRALFVAVAVVSAVIGAHSLNPRELYNEMYPVETIKRDAFHICGESDPTFVRAVGADRTACFDSMPHAIAIALGLVRPGGALETAALVDPSRQAELLMTLAAMPPRQPITTRRSFANTDWTRALAPCDDKNITPVVGYKAPSLLPPAPGTGRSAVLDGVVIGNLPPGPRAAQASSAGRGALPVMPLVNGKAMPPAIDGDKHGAAFAPLPAPDVGDSAQPVIVPLAPAAACSGA